MKTSLRVGITLLLLVGCGSRLKRDDAKKLDFSDDFDKVVKIKQFDESAKEAKPAAPLIDTKSKSKKKKIKIVKGKKVETEAPTRRQPPVEDDEGLSGRRPLVDPFIVGERVTYDMSYFTVSAGEMTTEIKPFVEVNGRKAYHFVFSAKSSSLFSTFYRVEDTAETFLDYDQLIPSTYSIHVNESKQLREVRAYWDYSVNKGKVWDKKVTKDKGVEEKNDEWPLEVFAQNVFSAPFYMRVFKFYPGKKMAFWVADGGENYLFRGEVLRKEKLRTAVGELDTLVFQPKFELKGVFKPVGDIIIWVTDDDRKTIVRIESKIKIGKVVAMIKSWNRPDAARPN